MKSTAAIQSCAQCRQKNAIRGNKIASSLNGRDGNRACLSCYEQKCNATVLYSIVEDLHVQENVFAHFAGKSSTV